MISMWTIFDHPPEYPAYFVARYFIMDQPTASLMLSETLDPLRDALAGAGFVMLARMPDDDPKIVEVWI